MRTPCESLPVSLPVRRKLTGLQVRHRRLSIRKKLNNR
jgi:hypothetical protein